MNNEYSPNLPENAYYGYATIKGGERRDDPIDEILREIEADKPEQEEKKLTEGWNLAQLHSDYTEPITDTSSHKFGNAVSYLNAAALEDGEHPQTILKATNIISRREEPEYKKHEDSIISEIQNSGDYISNESKLKIADAMHQSFKESGDDHLGRKYAWALHHGTNHMINPVATKEDHWLREDHVHNVLEQYKPIGGRFFQHDVSGAHFLMDHDGKLHSCKKPTYDEKASLHPYNPDTPEEALEKTRTHDASLQNSHGDYITSLPMSHARSVTDYTGYSSRINKATALVNLGKGVSAHPDSDAEEAHTHMERMHDIINGAPEYSKELQVWTGLARSVDPSKQNETSPGRKTMYLPAFTSTSIDHVTSNTFSAFKPHGIGDRQVCDVLSIKLHPDSSFLYVEGNSQNNKEFEAILPHGTQVEHNSHFGKETPEINPETGKPHNHYYVASGGKLTRHWGGGKVVGRTIHPAWDFHNEPVNQESHSPERLDMMMNSGISTAFKAATNSPHASSELLHNAIDYAGTRGEKRKHTFLAHLSTAPNLKSDHITKILYQYSNNPTIVQHILKHPEINENHLHTIVDANFERPGTMEMALKHPKISASTAEMATTATNSAAKIAAIKTGKLSDGTMKTMLSEPSAMVRLAAVEHGNLSKEDLHSLHQNDPHEFVKAAAAHKLGIVQESIERLLQEAISISTKTC